MVDQAPITLITACKKGLSKELRELIQAGEDVNQRDKNGYCGIHWAAVKGYTPCIEALLEAKDKLDINIIDNDGSTALIKAAAMGRADVLALLLENGALVNCKDHNGFSALHLASEKGHIECINVLHMYKANLNESSHHNIWTPLHIAAQHGREDSCRALLDIGADVNCIDSHQSTPLMVSCSSGYSDIAQLLLSKNSKLNSKDMNGLNALHYACRFGKPQCVDLILSSIGKFNFSNINVNERGNEQETRFNAMHFAAESNTKLGQPAPEKDIQENYAQCAKYLFKNGCELQPLATDYVTPLHIASDVGNDAVVEFLLEEGADPNCENVYGETPLHYALKRKRDKSIAHLLVHGASLHKESYDGVAPTDLMNIEEVMRIVYEQVFAHSIQTEDSNGYNILHHVCRWGKIEWVERFLEDCSEAEKIDVLFKSDSGRANHSPFILCIRTGNDCLACKLLQRFFTGKNQAAIKLLENENYYGKNILHLMFEMNCTKSLYSVLELLVHGGDYNHITLLPELLDINEQGHKPPLPKISDRNENYSRSSPTLYQKLYSLPSSPELTQHPVVKIVTDKKMRIYTVWNTFSLCFYLFYLLIVYLLLYNLTFVGTNPGGYPSEYVLYILLIALIIYDIICSAAKFLRVANKFFKKMPEVEMFENERVPVSKKIIGGYSAVTWLDVIEKQRHFRKFFKFRKFFVSSRKKFNGCLSFSKYLCKEYIFDHETIISLLSVIFLILFFIFHFSRLEFQWIFASLAYIFCTLRILEYLRSFIYTGPYALTLYKSAINDFPRFAIVFFVALVTFTGGFTLAIRNNSFVNFCNSYEDGIFCNSTQSFISGIRVLLDGDIISDPNYFSVLGFYPTLIYISFIVVTVVFLLNIFIAQLCNTYTHTLLSPQQYRYKVAVDFETKSVAFWVFGAFFQPLTALIKVRVSHEYWTNRLNAAELTDSTPGNTAAANPLFADLKQTIQQLQLQTKELKQEIISLKQK